MKILSLDTSAKVLSLAICEDERLIGQTTLNTGNTHSETILVVLDELLSKSGLTVGDIDLFACSSGPGSFTGVRIGVSFVKGLAFGSSKPCAGVSTLEAIAYNLKDCRGIICPVMDARREQLYNALFRSDGKTLKKLCPDRLISAKDLEAELAKYNKDIYFCGDGYDIAMNQIEHPKKRNINRSLTYQSAYSVAQIALEKYNKDECFGDASLTPTYLRASQAERELKEKKEKGGMEQ